MRYDVTRYCRAESARERTAGRDGNWREASIRCGKYRKLYLLPQSTKRILRCSCQLALCAVVEAVQDRVAHCIVAEGHGGHCAVVERPDRAVHRAVVKG